MEKKPQLGKESNIENILIVAALTSAKKEEERGLDDPSKLRYASTIEISKRTEELLFKNIGNRPTGYELLKHLKEQDLTIFLLHEASILENILIKQQPGMPTVIKFYFDPKIKFFSLTPDAEKVIELILRIENTKRQNFKYTFIVSTNDINALISEIQKYIKDQVKFIQTGKNQYSITILRGNPEINEISERAKLIAKMCIINIAINKKKFVNLLAKQWDMPYNKFESRRAIEDHFSTLKWNIWNKVENQLPPKIREAIIKKRQELLPKERLEQIKIEQKIQKRYKSLDEIVVLVKENIKQTDKKNIKSELKLLLKEIKKVIKLNEDDEAKARKEIEMYIAKNLDENWYNQFQEIIKLRSFLHSKYPKAFD
ncbi:MAG: hypothetical protein N3G74_01140 [Candidatus Micrarchaeota archaeon]|nr:hypothetical protein [Candidatus Micrarchaeota archaeon]